MSPPLRPGISARASSKSGALPVRLRRWERMLRWLSPAVRCSSMPRPRTSPPPSVAARSISALAVRWPSIPPGLSVHNLPSRTLTVAPRVRSSSLRPITSAPRPVSVRASSSIVGVGSWVRRSLRLSSMGSSLRSSSAPRMAPLVVMRISSAGMRPMV